MARTAIRTKSGRAIYRAGLPARKGKRPSPGQGALAEAVGEAHTP